MKPSIWVTKKSTVSLRNKITNDFGKKDHGGFNWFCATCSAHLAVDILEQLYDTGMSVDKTSK